MRTLPSFLVVSGFALLVSACGTPGGTGNMDTCGPSNCTGCCDSAGKCVEGSAPAACGAQGASCSTCEDTQICHEAACVSLSNDVDAGMTVVDDGGLPDVVNATEAIVAPKEQWTWIDFPDTKCANGTATGLGVNITDKSTDVLIYFEPGGACWDDFTCWTAGTAAHIKSGFNKAIFEDANQTYLDFSMFNRNVANNPVKNMSFVYIPYCTGDVHAGNTIKQYNAQNPRLTYHVGQKNQNEYIKRLKATFPNVTRMYLTGSSAGGYSAQMNFPRYKRNFPNTEMHSLADCSQIITPNGSRLSQFLNAWDLPIPEACDCRNDFPAYIDWLATTYPTSRFGLLAFDKDPTLMQFFNYTQTNFAAQTNSLLANKYIYPNTKYYFVKEAKHVMIQNLFVGTSGGVKMVDFVGKWIGGDPTWSNAQPAQ